MFPEKTRGRESFSSLVVYHVVINTYVDKTRFLAIATSLVVVKISTGWIFSKPFHLTLATMVSAGSTPPSPTRSLCSSGQAGAALAKLKITTAQS